MCARAGHTFLVRFISSHPPLQASLLSSLPYRWENASPIGLEHSTFLPPTADLPQTPTTSTVGIPGGSAGAQQPLTHWQWQAGRYGSWDVGKPSKLCTTAPGPTYPPAGASHSRACRRLPASLRVSRCFSLDVTCKGGRKKWLAGPSHS